MHKRLGGDPARTTDPRGPRGYSTPFSIIPSNKWWGKEGEGAGGTYRVMAFVFPGSHYCDESLMVPQI